MKPNDEISFAHPELRLGYVAALYDMVTGEPALKQLDLLNRWFPGLIFALRDSSGTVKEPPEFDDRKRIIYVTPYHGSLYLGGSPRVTQIAGRLVGTASSNLEKERLSAQLIQKNICRRLLSGTKTFPAFLDHVAEMIARLSEEKAELFHYVTYMFTLSAAEAWYDKQDYERDRELYPFDEEVFDSVIYNAFYQLMREEPSGLVYGYAWLLLGSLLRNECGRLTRTYDSSFVPLFRHPGEDSNLLSQLHYLLAPEEFESYYDGDDTESRFPGIEWMCDSCHAHLNEQPGFDDHLPVWQCRACGHLNELSLEEIYESEEDWRSGIHRG